MRKMFHVTYDVVTPESAEHGDTADNGFIRDDGVGLTCAGLWGQAAGALKARCAMSLHSAVLHLGWLTDEGNDVTLYEADARLNLRSGEEERRAFHMPEGITSSSRERVLRVLRNNRLIA